MPAEGERHHHRIHADRGDTPPQKQHGPGRGAAVSGDEVGDSTVDEHGLGGTTGRIADSAVTEVEQPTLKESRVVQSGRGPSEQSLERTDTEEERRLRGHGEYDRTPGTSTTAQSDRRDRQRRQAHGLAGEDRKSVV